MDLARTHRALLLAAALTVTLTAWWWLYRSPHHPGASFLSALLMWQAMTAAMMTPTTLNWLFAFAAFARSGGRSVSVAVSEFAAGYFAVWLGFSLAAAALQIALQRAGLLAMHGGAPSPAAGAILIAAGLLHLTPLSRSCLKHCRNPLTYFLSRWNNRPARGFRVGMVHGAYCVGCCWALMLTGFAVGVMNLLWMAALTLAMCIEKLTPAGDRAAWLFSLALILAGAALLTGHQFPRDRPALIPCTAGAPARVGPPGPASH